jgi:hypothetical protein
MTGIGEQRERIAYQAADKLSKQNDDCQEEG